MSNPSIGTAADEKKILGAAVEKYGDNQFAQCPKCYTIQNDKADGSLETKSLKVKGVSLKQNCKIHPSSYLSVIHDNKVLKGKNINLQMNHKHNSDGKISIQMSRVTIKKNSLMGY